MWRVLLVGLGGMVGSIARYLVTGRVQVLIDSPFPVGTMVVNVAGSFALGLILALSLERGMLGVDLRLLLAVGFCGGFTTMSTFSFEALSLLQQGLTGLALGYVAATLGVCLLATWCGIAAGRAL